MDFYNNTYGFISFEIKKCYRLGAYAFLFAFAIVCINGIVADFLYVPIVNPFILFIFADISPRENQHKKEYINSKMNGLKENEINKELSI